MDEVYYTATMCKYTYTIYSHIIVPVSTVMAVVTAEGEVSSMFVVAATEQEYEMPG